MLEIDYILTYNQIIKKKRKDKLQVKFNWLNYGYSFNI